MTDLTLLPWAAGLYEGEGSIVWQSKSIALMVPSSDLDVLNKLAPVLPGMRVQGPYSRPGRKPMWRAECYSRNAYAAAVMLYPFLLSRRQGQIDAVLRRWLAQPTRAKLTTPQRREIKARRSRGESLASLAAEFAVSLSTISAIGRGRIKA